MSGNFCPPEGKLPRCRIFLCFYSLWIFVPPPEKLPSPPGTEIQIFCLFLSFVAVSCSGLVWRHLRSRDTSGTLKVSNNLIVLNFEVSRDIEMYPPDLPYCSQREGEWACETGAMCQIGVLNRKRCMFLPQSGALWADFGISHVEWILVSKYYKIQHVGFFGPVSP